MPSLKHTPPPDWLAWPARLAGSTAASDRSTSALLEATGELAWPDIESMLGDDFDLTWSRRAKYRIRLLGTSSVRRRLLRECARNPFALALLGRRPRAFYPVMNHLLDRRLATQQRLTVMVASLRKIDTWLLQTRQAELLAGDLTLLTLDDGSRITFGLSGVSFHEGLWQVGLIASSGRRLYSLGFGFTDTRTLLIGNVQGPSLGVDGPALIRQATHAAHGMRPPHLLLHALRLLVKQWDVEVLLGIDPGNHVKGRWNLRRSRLRFDYEAFWIEQGAMRDRGGNWRLPLAVDTRALANVPTKRRAMYRRRYAMLTQLEAAIAFLSSRADIDVGTAQLAPIDIEFESDRPGRGEASPAGTVHEVQAASGAIHS
jgi:uncharacterized protein